MRELAAPARLLILLAGITGAAMPASAVTLEPVPVGDPGNAADTPSKCFSIYCGSVSYDYGISKYEITNANYAEFLNAKAKTDPFGLYNTNMSTDPQGGITRSFIPGSFEYAAKPGFENKPVNFVSFWDAVRFTNWLNNFQGDGDTETGAYTLLGGTATPSNGSTLVRNAGANIFLPTESEWYKAAYYDPQTKNYYAYPAGSNAGTTCTGPSAASNRANCNGSAGGPSNVGTYTGSPSPSGTFDQGGNVWEWNEEITDGGAKRGRRGGDFNGSAGFLAASDARDSSPELENVGVGFRVVGPSYPIAGFAVPVSARRNAPDTPSNCFAAECGAVPYDYLMGAYEVTNAQYAWFLNVKARQDPFGLFNPLMETEARGGITRTGNAGFFDYVVKPGFANKPVNFVSFYDALRFVNWMHNGLGSGHTESGAYTLLGLTPTPSNGPAVSRNPGANVFLPSENEWYKAAYYDAATESYFDYPTGSNTETVCSAPTSTPNRANCGNDAGGLTDWGAYTGSQSPFGTYDQGGNVWEWNEELTGGGSDRGRRGGSLDTGVGFLAASALADSSPTLETGSIGFRVAFPAPEPGSQAAGVLALAALAALQKRRAQRPVRAVGLSGTLRFR